MSKERPYPTTLASMRHILVEALSSNSRHIQYGDKPTTIPTGSWMENSCDNGRAHGSSFASSEKVPSSTPQTISLADATPLSSPSGNFPGLAPELTPKNVPITPTPLQTINNPDSPTASPFISPIRPLNSCHCAVSSSSPTHTLDDHPAAYEVDVSFLRAMVGLLERQANIEPENLFTEADVQRIVQKKLQMQDKNIVLPSEDTTRLAPHITWTLIMALMLGGVIFVVFQRAYLIAPEHLWWLLGGAWKGAACGMASSMLAKGILAGIDKWRFGGNVVLRR